MLPKKQKIDINLNPPKPGHEYMKFGLDRINELMALTDRKSTFLPLPVDFFDMNLAVRDYFKTGEGKLIVTASDSGQPMEVPVFYMTNERWGEFQKTWIIADEDKNVSTPYITIRRTNRETGTRLGGKWTVPNGKLFKYVDVPILDEGQEIFLRFKINQPINVDSTYEVKLFTKYIEDVDLMDKQILKLFSSRQVYVFPKGNPMPMVHEGLGEDTNIQDINGDRMYVMTYTIKLLGFLLTSEDFQIVKTYRKPNITFNTTDKPKRVVKNAEDRTFDDTFDGTFD